MNAAERLERYIESAQRTHNREVRGVVITPEFYAELEKLGRVEKQFFIYGDHEDPEEVEVTFHRADEVIIEMEGEREKINDAFLRTREDICSLLAQST